MHAFSKETILSIPLPIRIDQSARKRYHLAVSDQPKVETEAPVHEAGCMERIVALAVVLLIASLGYAVYLVFQPQNLSDLKSDAVEARDLKSVFSQSIEGSYPLTITEDEINAYFAKTLALKQGGACSGFVQLEKVLVRLEKDRAEIIMVRRVCGHPFTLSTWVSFEQTENEQGEIKTIVNFTGGPLALAPGINRGGRFGKLVVPQGFVLMIRPGYEALAAQYTEEIRLGFEEMSRIRIEENALILDPRFHQNSDSFGF